jgi:hypothetical protein
MPVELILNKKGYGTSSRVFDLKEISPKTFGPHCVRFAHSDRVTHTLPEFLMLLVPVKNWEPHGVTLAGYCYAMRQELKFHFVTPYRVSHLKRYGVTERGNVTSVYPP